MAARAPQPKWGGSSKRAQSSPGAAGPCSLSHPTPALPILSHPAGNQPIPFIPRGDAGSPTAVLSCGASSCSLTPQEPSCPCKQPPHKQGRSPHSSGRHSPGMVSIRAVIYCLGLEEGKAEGRGGASNPAFCAELPVLGERGEGVTPCSKRLSPPAQPLLHWDQPQGTPR